MSEQKINALIAEACGRERNVKSEIKLEDVQP